MEYRQNRLFNSNQFKVVTQLPDDVFFAFMSLVKNLNLELKEINGMVLTPDDVFSLAIEDFASTYGLRMDKLLKRLGV